MDERNRRRVGGEYERRTADWLSRRGYRILAQNYRCRTGEIDLIAAKERTIAFVEVKYRGNDTAGAPEDAVNAAKQRRIYRTAEVYLTAHPWYWEWDCRFDAAAFDADGNLRYYPGAFGGL